MRQDKGSFPDPELPQGFRCQHRRECHNNHHKNMENAGEGIRTHELLREQILSLSPLTAWLPPLLYRVRTTILLRKPHLKMSIVQVAHARCFPACYEIRGWYLTFQVSGKIRKWLQYPVFFRKSLVKSAAHHCSKRHHTPPHPSTTNRTTTETHTPPHIRDHSKQDREQRQPEKHRHQPDPVLRVIESQAQERHNSDTQPKTERDPLDAVQIVLPRKQCSNERVSGQEEHEQQTKQHPHRRLVKPRSQHEEDARERQGDHECEVDGDSVWWGVWHVHLFIYLPSSSISISAGVDGASGFIA